MGMSNYVMDAEEKMFDVIEQAIGNCEHLTDVMAEAVKQRKLVPHWSIAEIEDCCSEYWEEYWASKIQVDISRICVIVNSKLKLRRDR